MTKLFSTSLPLITKAAATTILLLLLLICSHQITSSPIPVTHSLFSNALKRHVSKGELASVHLNVVDYESMGNDTDFSTYMRELATIPNFNETMSQVPKQDYYAFFINAYNAFAIKTIVSHPCSHDFLGRCHLQSITDLGVLRVWKQRNYELGGEKWSLDDIEYLLRGVNCDDVTGDCDKSKFPSNVPKAIPSKEIDYRIHACLVCTSISCPDLAPEAYEPGMIEVQMANAFNGFIANKQKGFKVEQEKITLSPIFQWYKKDFSSSTSVKHEDGNNAVLEYIHHYMKDSHPQKDFLSHHLTDSPDYFYYNWDLNMKPGTDIPCYASDGSNTQITRQCLSFIQQLQFFLSVVFGGVGIMSVCYCLCCVCLLMCCCACCIFRETRPKRRQYYQIQA